MTKKEKINRIFKAIADPTRRDIFHILVLASSALSLTQISEKFDISRQGTTKHIKLLEDAGLVKITDQGRERYCLANLNALNDIRDWLAFYDKFWDDSLKKLDNYLSKK